MKKLFILLFSLAMFNTIFAQSNDNRNWKGNANNENYGQSKKNDVYSRDNKDWKQDTKYTNYGQSKKNNRNDGQCANNNSTSTQERNQQIAQINREYTNQIEAVKRDRRFSRYDKERQLIAIQRQRDYRINQLNQLYVQNNNGRYDNRTANNDRRNW
ncbi:MAG TPA: hypothetical protein VF623_10810 [Segetibacter sp.]|jgi:hypothetical protein